jgi:hypothetical protein
MHVMFMGGSGFVVSALDQPRSRDGLLLPKLRLRAGSERGKDDC